MEMEKERECLRGGEGVFIHEALAAVSLEARKPYIRRSSWRRLSNSPMALGIRIQPTNSPDGCIVESDVETETRRRWNPTADDLMADDWESC